MSKFLKLVRDHAPSKAKLLRTPMKLSALHDAQHTWKKHRPPAAAYPSLSSSLQSRRAAAPNGQLPRPVHRTVRRAQSCLGLCRVGRPNDAVAHEGSIPCHSRPSPRSRRHCAGCGQRSWGWRSQRGSFHRGNCLSANKALKHQES